ncbi:hypothetical protein AXW84_02640 [Hymenobacter sp. PAMC 26628]|nr:hypothetical protein AXW84_02640 [Hymenobacter sp. PAMC 26628]
MASATAVSAQVEIGIKVSPSVTYLRTDAASTYQFKDEKSQLGFGGGLIVDYFFGENYAFSTGLMLTGKGGTYSYQKDYRALNPNDPLIPKGDVQKLSTQYLELPLTVKLFTNEIAPATRLYFQLGGSLAVPIGARINGEKRYTDPDTNEETTALSHVLFIDANALVAFGAEYQLGRSTKLLAGLSYHRGLVNLDHYFEKTRGFSDVTIKNNVFALDLGMKF